MSFFKNISTAVFMLLAVAFFLLGGNNIALGAKTKIILWHTQDGQQVIFLKHLMTDFSKIYPAYEVKVEDVLEFDVSLHKAAQFGILPDVIFAPGDMVSLREELQLSPITKSSLNSRIDTKKLDTVTLDRQIYGAPVLGGNHLVVYWNNSMLPTAPTDIKQLKWPINDGYFFLPFLFNYGAFDVQKLKFADTQMLDLLKSYRKIGQEMGAQLNPQSPESVTSNTNAAADVGRDTWNESERRVSKTHPIEPSDVATKDSVSTRLSAAKQCSYICVLKEFYEGKIPAIINGEWAYDDSLKRLGRNLEVRELPNYKGIPLHSPGGTFALMFPKQGLLGNKKDALLALVSFMQSRTTQTQFLRTAKRIPVHQDVLKFEKQNTSNNFLKILNLNDLSLPIKPHHRLPYFWAGLTKGLGHLNLYGARESNTLKIMNSTMDFAKLSLQPKEAK